MVIYQVRYSNKRIEELECKRTTKEFIIFPDILFSKSGECRLKKKTKHYSFWEKLEEAKRELVNFCRKKYKYNDFNITIIKNVERRNMECREIKKENTIILNY